MATREAGSWVLIFDGECGLCRAAVERVRRWDRSRRVECVPYQDEGRLAETGIPREAAEREMWLVAADGRRWGGAEAVARLLRLLPGGGPLGRLLDLPPLRPLARLLYRRVAGHRRRISRLTRTGDSCPVPAEDGERR